MEEKIFYDICGVRVPSERLHRFIITETFKNVEILIKKGKKESLLGKEIIKAYNSIPTESYINIIDCSSGEEELVYSIGNFEAIHYEFNVIPSIGISERVSILLKEEIE